MQHRLLLSLFVFALATGGAQAASRATVESLHRVATTDLVRVSGGWQEGFRLGMVCQVSRAGTSVGELLLVDLGARSAIALIVQLAPGQVLQGGDTVSVKISQKPVS